MAIANLDPSLSRRAKPASVEALLEWAPEPLATAEIVLIMQEPESAVRAALARCGDADSRGRGLLLDRAVSVAVTASRPSRGCQGDRFAAAFGRSLRTPC